MTNIPISPKIDLYYITLSVSRMKILNIYSDWIGRWVHLIATWHPSAGSSVFVDGIKQGRSYVFRSRSDPRVTFTTRNISLFVGSSMKTKTIKKTGKLKALFYSYLSKF